MIILFIFSFKGSKIHGENFSRMSSLEILVGHLVGCKLPVPRQAYIHATRPTSPVLKSLLRCLKFISGLEGTNFHDPCCNPKHLESLHFIFENYLNQQNLILNTSSWMCIYQSYFSHIFAWNPKHPVLNGWKWWFPTISQVMVWFIIQLKQP